MTTTGPTERHRRRTGVRALAGLAALLMLGLPSVTASADDGYPLRANVASLGDPAPDFVLRGRGWGHSAGMSQYGAYAMARAGRDEGQILSHYYPGTNLDSASEDQQITVAITPPSPRNQPVTALGRPLTWRTCESATPSEPCPTITQPAGETWSLRSVSGQATRIQLRDASGSTVFAATGGQVWTELTPRDRFQDADGRLHLEGNCGTSAPVRCYAYGRFLFSVTGEQVRLSNQLPMEAYLRGIAEVPSSWGNDGPAALRAQAIIARSYVLGRGRTTCATPACQVFAGYGKEIAASGGNWVDAVRATRGQVLRNGSAIANTYYSSSHGGRAEASEDSWAYGGAVSYLRSVDDPWSLEAPNPMRSWTTTARNADLRRVTGSSAIVTQFEIRTRTSGGSPSAVRVHALDGSIRDFTTTPDGAVTRTCNRRHAGNSLRCDLPVRGTLNAGGQAFAGSGDRTPSSQITSIGFAPFTDDVGSLHEYATVWANRAGIAQGVDATSFAPRRAVNRAQMASFLDRTFQLPAASGQPFRDVSSGPHRDAIARVAAAGIALGYDDGTYRPSQPVTREQMATFLTRAMGLQPRDANFRDVSGVHARNVGALAGSGITAGCDTDRFCPGDPVRRDQMTTFLYRAVRSLR